MIINFVEQLNIFDVCSNSNEKVRFIWVLSQIIMMINLNEDMKIDKDNYGIDNVFLDAILYAQKLLD